jgi:ABC-type polysaccharide/polyol phosphate transport system ATPase subunit
MVETAKAIIIVTHDLAWVTDFCNRALLLDHGEIVKEGEPADLVDLYKERSARVSQERELEALRFVTAKEERQAVAARR